MKLVPDENNLPRLHLAGTLAILFLLIFLLAGLFAWQGWRAHRTALRNIETAAQQEIQARLESEMASVLGMIDFSRARAEAILARSLVDQVDAAHGVAQGIYEREAGRRSPAEVRRLILEALRPVRFFGGRGYVFVNDMQGHIRLLPPNPEFESQLGPGKRDDTGRPIMASLIEAARKPRGEGWARYRWYSPENPRRMADKLSYVRHFAPCDWLIGVGDYLHYWEEHQRGEALDRLRATRFGRTGHVSVTSLQGSTILLPTAPQLEGMHNLSLPERESDVVAHVTGLAQQGGGFLSYDWPDPETRALRRKTALVRPYQPWGWVLTVTMLDDELTASVRQELERQQLMGREQALLLLASLLAVGGSWWFSRWLGRLFQDYHRRNLEQQQALQEGEDRLNAILDSVDASIFIKGTDYRYRYVNRKTAEEMARQRSDIIGRDDVELLCPERAKLARQTDQRVFLHGERVQSEWLGETGGRSVALATVKLPLRDVHGRIYALCGVTTDVSEHKRVEQVLAQARDAAEAANRAKSDFLSNVSHELRTPLNSILGMLHLVFRTPLSARQQDCLLQVQAAGQQLHDIIIDMLDYASLDSGRLQLQSGSFMLGEMLDRLAARRAAQAARKQLDFGITVDAEVPHQLIGDSRRLAQALQHYLDNAIKFTEQGAVRSRVGLQRREAGRVLLRFEVRDSGIGIEQSRRERLFQHIEQGDASSTRRHGGAGLGLVLVRQLAGLMGGEVGCDSLPGQGAAFWFTAWLGTAEVHSEAMPDLPYRWPHDAGVDNRSSEAAALDSDPDQWQRLRERLLALLREDDVDSLDLFEQHAPLLRSALGQRYAEFAQSMRSYDFPAALELLQEPKAGPCL